MDKNIAAEIKSIAASLKDEAVELRRDFHANPEPSWEEVETTKKIRAYLEKLGLKIIKQGYGGTECGVLAELDGASDGPTVALRADIDSLRLTEENDLSFRSKKPGAMHACGHDAHAAGLLCTAKLMSQMRDKICGRVRFLFQPAEEHGIKSGAKAMIDEGAIEGVEAIGGLHIWSSDPTGQMVWKKGPFMASADGWTVTFTGKGGHGSAPQQCFDPTIAASNFILAAQTIVSRELDPQSIAVVSVGVLTSGSAFNIIPERATVTGNIRTFDPAVRNSMEERIRRLAEGIGAAYRCKGELDFTYMLPSTINHAGATDVLIDAGRELVGEAGMNESELVMGSEDFSYFLEKIPGTFFYIGCGCKEKGTDAPHHNPRFDLDEDALPNCVTMLSGYAFNMLDAIRSGSFKK